MKWINAMERRFGRFAIRNLMLYLDALYIIGFLIYMTNPLFYFQYLSLDVSQILHGQIWRVITFLAFPPSSNLLMTMLLVLIYYSLGQTLEQVLGVFRFNLFIFLGIFGYVLAAFLLYAFGYPSLLVADSLYLTMILMFTALFPDAYFRLYFVIPIKAKWVGLLDGLLILYQFIRSTWPGRIALVLSLLNFLVFYIAYRKPVTRAKETRRKVIYHSDVQRASSGPRHRCAVCGRTELDSPDLEFRYCSKCEGGREYCMEHLYTHVHVTKGK